MSKGKVYRVDETIVKKSLRDWKTVMKEALIALDLFGLIRLVSKAF
jgi:hypothetical protein